MSYVEAVRLLLGGADAVTIAGRAGGGLLLAAAPFAPDAVLGLFDAKGEANNLLRDLVGRAPARIRAERGKSHLQLLESAHGLLVLSSFFDALAEKHGDRFAALELTDDEKRRIGDTVGLRAQLREGQVAPMPGATRGFAENVPEVEASMRGLAKAFGGFVSQLAAGRGMEGLEASAVDRALEIYRERYTRLAADVPEFAIWSQLDEHAATRAEIRDQNQTLADLSETLRRVVDAPTPATEAEQRLANHAAEVLRRPIWQAESRDITFPTVEQGFVSPRFRLAVVDDKSQPADEQWWESQEEHEDLAGFLTGYLTDPASTERPLVILGNPGAGKSLLTKVLAARLPAEVFTTFRVPLRAVDPDADIHQQVEAAAEELIHERLPWADLCRASDTTKVVMLDGFDELIQATGVTQSNYLHHTARFQQQEWINGRSVAVVVTSRTLVMDRTAVPDGTLVIKLDPFDDRQIEHWVEVWNAANESRPTVRPLTVEELEGHSELAEQPLLLLMLAIYAASGEARLDAQQLSTEDLYGRLLDSFVRRQIREKAEGEVDEEILVARETQSRRDLATVAFAMFNRGHQWIGEADLQADLQALEQGGGPAGTASSRSVTWAQRTITSFFFVHTAHTGDETHGPGRRTYEFMHATFGEYLIAEQTAALLADLAEDWRRSRGRAYGYTLDDRVLRALLSHQPLTIREQIIPFVGELIADLEPGVRQDLRHALTALYREARRTVQDDPYRPTPFDAVSRLAAYTANLVLLAVLVARPDGLTVTELSEPADSPNLESTVKLWRAGLDAEAQRSLFGCLVRDDDRFRVMIGSEHDSITLSEARLIRDRGQEVVQITGEMLSPASYPSQAASEFQIAFHRGVLGIMAARWSTPLLERLMPYDENLYVKLAELIEGAGENALVDSAFLLVRLLVDDDLRIPDSLLHRLVEAVFVPELIPLMQPHISALALRRPELLRRQPALLEGAKNWDRPEFLYELARSARSANSPDVDSLLTVLAERVTDEEAPSILAVASMVRNQTFAPRLLAAAVRDLRRYGSLAWEQLRPSEMLTALETMGDDEATRVVVALREYVDCRSGDAFGEADAQAFEELQRRFSVQDGSDARQSEAV
ncbi:hypothetical protein Aab01nite_77310 [Paractinoplanes abujensis]|uniref:NACHT domain-containing protein n=1 Tax=Paractinoplanes abujensis TaxID=882441 RepID=UPI001A563661|nr:hypothetical protein Aab01nite_77310 [Actinoplanes abujensis]